MVSYDVKKPDLADIKAYLGEAFPEIKKKAKETIDLTAVEDDDEKDQGDDVGEVEDIPDDKLDPENMPVKSLRQALARRGLYTRGLKAELIRRLKEYLDAKKAEAGDAQAEGGDADAKEGEKEGEGENEAASGEKAPEEAQETTPVEAEASETAKEAEEKKTEGEGEAMDEDAPKEVNGTAAEGEAAEEKPAEEEVVEPEVTQTYTVVMVLKRAPRMKKRFDDLLSRSDIDKTRVVILEFEATTGGDTKTPERKKDPKVVIDQAVKGPMSLQFEDTVWPEIQEGEGSFKDVVTALLKDRDAFLELETEVNNADKLFMDNQNLKKRVQYLSNELELSKTKCKDLQALINNSVAYLKSNGKTPLPPPEAEPKEPEKPEEDKAADTTETKATEASKEKETK